MRVLHDHVDVLLTDTLGIDLLVVSGSWSRLGWLSLGISSLGGSGGLGLSCHLLSLLQVETALWVVNLDLSEDGEGVAVLTGAHHSWVVNNKDNSVLLLEGDTGDSLEALHTDLGESLAGLLLSLLESWTVYATKSNKLATTCFFQ